MNIRFYLNEKLINIFEALGYDKKYAKCSFSDRLDLAHLQCNSSFQLAKELGESPMAIAEKIANKCKEELSVEFDITFIKPGFVNFIIKDEFLQKIANTALWNDRLSIPITNQTKTIVLDYGGANVAKPLHVGHMRSAIIGESLKRLNRFLGNMVISDVHLGDWGMQMGLTIAQLMDDYDLGYYFNEPKKKVEITMEMLDIAYPKASLRKKTDEEFNKRASDIVLYFQSKKDGYYQIWKEIVSVSIVGIKEIYKMLGVSFDLWNGESTVCDLVPSVIKTFVDKKLAIKSDGALIVDVAKEDDCEPMPPAIIEKFNGAQMYHITDIATIVKRENDYHPDLILILTDNRQSLHFKQVFRCVRLAKLVPESCELQHISFGTVNGKDGKPFKTRDGGTMHLEDLISMVTDKANEKLKESKLAKPDRELARKIGVAALIFGDLINVINKDYIFDIDKFMNFEGKTGPYLQYSAVRIKSLLEKGNMDRKFDAIINSPESRNIVLAFLKFVDSFETCYRENSLNSMCASLFDLASAYSTYYNNVRILSETNEINRQSSLRLSKLVLNSLEIGCNILLIEIPDKM